jgi:hypothetical protein
LGAFYQFACGRAPASQLVRTAGAHMLTGSLVSVVEDDQFFRDSMRRLMRSLGYNVAAAAAADGIRVLA